MKNPETWKTSLESGIRLCGGYFIYYLGMSRYHLTSKFVNSSMDVNLEGQCAGGLDAFVLSRISNHIKPGNSALCTSSRK